MSPTSQREYMMQIDALKEQLAAMTQERDIAKHNEQCTHNANKLMESQLFAAQAREQQLREALEEIRRHGIEAPHPWAKEIATDALALPQDDSALREWGAKLLAEIEALRKDAERWRFFRIADWADWNAVFRVDHDGLSLPDLLDKATDAAMKG